MVVDVDDVLRLVVDSEDDESMIWPVALEKDGDEVDDDTGTTVFVVLDPLDVVVVLEVLGDVVLLVTGIVVVVRLVVESLEVAEEDMEVAAGDVMGETEVVGELESDDVLLDTLLVFGASGTGTVVAELCIEEVEGITVVVVVL